MQAAGKHLRQHFDGVLPGGQQMLMCVVPAADHADDFGLVLLPAFTQGLF